MPIRQVNMEDNLRIWRENIFPMAQVSNDTDLL